jgi:myo-inositol-1-phosphate synthase
MVDEAQLESAKSVYAVVEEDVGVTFVNVLPAATYPVPDVSLVAE